ncbi:hypothetical protein ACFO25_02360 [Paenactinomyces guangxiensis]|uniref:Uncharacterized protein n=1 Tax=Paenactinomyces guangxiensis TaxID=1490290 RepID=A0A7W1WUN3_9BACL|nr:hypothetical protein [Paenactinomyces guangxiensis]MBA4496371.1 hypothetical protein [Paenactinomyces guangxiensis]MBH8593516.1 hypothetical protein [Paenactinomyces guangxiensis]
MNLVCSDETLDPLNITPHTLMVSVLYTPVQLLVDLLRLKPLYVPTVFLPQDSVFGSVAFLLLRTRMPLLLSQSMTSRYLGITRSHFHQLPVWPNTSPESKHERKDMPLRFGSSGAAIEWWQW